MEFDDDVYEDDFLEDTKKVALYIMDAAGNIEDILIDLDDIKQYINKLYERYPFAD